MSNPYEPCKRKKFARQMKSSSSSGDYPTESSESDGSDECRRGRSSRRGKQVKTAPISSASEELSDSSSDDESVEVEPEDYVFQRKYNLTEAEVEKIDALVQKIEPKIPVLVVMMKKTNVKQYPDLAILKDYAIKHFREARVGRYPLGSNDISTNLGIIQTKIADYVDTPKGYDDDTKQPSGRKRCASCQADSSRGHRHTTKKPAKPTSFEKSGDNSPSEYDSFESSDNRTRGGPNYGLSLGSCLSGAQYERVIAHVERIQPETAVFIVAMSQRDVQMPSPLLNISEEHAIAHFPPESVTVTLQMPGKGKKWHPRFYMAKDRREYVLTGHWLDFIRDNSVQEGDICIFVPEKGGGRCKFTIHLLCGETTHSRGGTAGGQEAGSRKCKTKTKMASPVHIMEKSTDGENDSSESNMHTVSDEPLETGKSDGLQEPPYILPLKSALSASQKKIVKARVQAIQSEVPIYVSIMKKSNISAIKQQMLELGSRYAARYLPHRRQTIVLRCHGESWETKMVTNGNGKRWFLSGGWSKFARDNRLRIGDICLFEQKKNRRKLTMKVHIIPAKQC
ncbi:unnamed protein product [Alopecurus aequalis]